MSFLGDLIEFLRRHRDPAPAPPPVAPSLPGGYTEMQQALLVVHNQARAARGLPPLAPDPRLCAAAQGHADRMAAAGTLAHQLPGEPDPFARMRDAGYAYMWAGENIADGQLDAPTVVEDWLDDPPHAANVLGHYTHLGAGLAAAADGTLYWCCDYGRPAS